MDQLNPPQSASAPAPYFAGPAPEGGSSSKKRSRRGKFRGGGGGGGGNKRGGPGGGGWGRRSHRRGAEEDAGPRVYDQELVSGALLVRKPAGISSFGVLEDLLAGLGGLTGLRKADLPKLGHGGTLDPFATGLLMVCVGDAVKLARYFLGAKKTYRGVMRFGVTTVPGDPTAEISETNERLPSGRSEIQELASSLTLQPYLQTPPMHSAKKHKGQPLYELARQGIEIDRDARECILYKFEISDYQAPLARFHLVCSSGTYVRTLAQDIGRMAGTVAMLESLERTASGSFGIEAALDVPAIVAHLTQALPDAAVRKAQPADVLKELTQLGCWVPFDKMLDGYPKLEVTEEEAKLLARGNQGVLTSFFRQLAQIEENCVVLKIGPKLVGTLRRDAAMWGVERMFVAKPVPPAGAARPARGSHRHGSGNGRAAAGPNEGANAGMEGAPPAPTGPRAPIRFLSAAQVAAEAAAAAAQSPDVPAPGGASPPDSSPGDQT